MTIQHLVSFQTTIFSADKVIRTLVIIACFNRGSGKGCLNLLNRSGQITSSKHGGEKTTPCAPLILLYGQIFTLINPERIYHLISPFSTTFDSQKEKGETGREVCFKPSCFHNFLYRNKKWEWNKTTPYHSEPPEILKPQGGQELEKRP
jgi:hypothetical protein